MSGAALDAVLGPGPSLVDARTGERLIAAELEERVAAVAGGLRRAGVGRGDVVTWRLPNSPAVVVLYRACWRLGAVAAPVHHRAGDADAAASLAQVDVAFEVGGETDVDRLADAGGRPGGAVPAGAIDVEPDALAAVLFTAGSTGRSKAVLHTQATLAYKAATMPRVHALVPDDVVLMPAPMAHVSGLLNGILVPAAAGMTTVTMAAWDPDEALGLIAQERVSYMLGPPTFFVTMAAAASFSPGVVASLRLVSSGGTGVTPATVTSIAATFGCVAKRAYGSTEAPTVTATWAGDPFERGRDTDGRATGDVELRVVEGGELWVRGPEVCCGYASTEDTARAFTDDGWYRTGDLAVLEDGWLTITGRLSDVIIRGGEKIAAGEVEAVLEAHPAVRQAVAVPFPDDRLGERVCAFVVLDTGATFDLDGCRAWFESHGVTRYKWPERVEVVGALPLLPAGKPDRAALKRRAAGRP